MFFLLLECLLFKWLVSCIHFPNSHPVTLWFPARGMFYSVTCGCCPVLQATNTDLIHHHQPSAFMHRIGEVFVCYSVVLFLSASFNFFNLGTHLSDPAGLFHWVCNVIVESICPLWLLDIFRSLILFFFFPSIGQLEFRPIFLELLEKSGNSQAKGSRPREPSTEADSPL